jgi:hypothetical protein
MRTNEKRFGGLMPDSATDSEAHADTLSEYVGIATDTVVVGVAGGA